MSRVQEIATHILNMLADWEEPANEVVIHAQVDTRVEPSALLAEFRDALSLLEKSHLITGVRNPLRGTRWAITDKGRAARHQ